MSSAKWRPLCLGLNVLTHCSLVIPHGIIQFWSTLFQMIACHLLGAKPISGLIRSWVPVIGTHRTNLIEIWNKIKTFFIKENTFVYVICKMVDILYRPWHGKMRGGDGWGWIDWVIMNDHSWRLINVYVVVCRVYWNATIWCTRSCIWYTIITLRPEQNGWYFADNFFNGVFMKEYFWILTEISLKFVPHSSINDKSVMIQIMAWCQTGDRPLPEQMKTDFSDAYIHYSGCFELYANTVFVNFFFFATVRTLKSKNCNNANLVITDDTEVCHNDNKVGIITTLSFQCIYWWFCARIQYIQCIGNGDTVVL